MKYITTFLAGGLIGAVLMFTSLKYHVVRAKDGIHLAPKMSSQLSETYVDIREFQVQDWDEHRTLAAALINSDKGYLLQDSASENLRSAMTDVISSLTGERR